MELGYRRSRGENPTREEYVQKFPDDADAVRNVFDEPPVAHIAESSFSSQGRAVPEMLGKFQVIGRLGTGGQGSALSARDLDLGRFVVLKLYHASAGSPGGDGAIGDGQALSRLRSRYVPQCYGIERIGNELVLVMEYVPGRNLAEALKSGHLDARAAVRLIEQVAEGLEAVQACGLVHRDIKPANVVVGEDHVPRLVDFGLAAHLGSGHARGHGYASLHGTRAGAGDSGSESMGEPTSTDSGPSSMPSCAASLPIPDTTRASLWSTRRMGVVTPPRVLNRSIPRDLERVVIKALEADPSQRYLTVNELRKALKRCRFPYRYRSAVLASASILVIAVAFPVVHHLSRSNPADPISLGLQAHQLIKVDRGGRELSLHDAVPLISGDKLWIECDLPAGWFASAFWFDTVGRLTELAPLKITRHGRLDRLSYPPSDAVTVEGPPGTEFILVCARRGSPPGRNEIAALLPVDTAWPSLPLPAVVWLEGENLALNDAPHDGTSGSTRGPGAWQPSAVRDAINPIAEAHERLCSKFAYVVGAAFAHGEPEGSLAEARGTYRGIAGNPSRSPRIKP